MFGGLLPNFNPYSLIRKLKIKEKYLANDYLTYLRHRDQLEADGPAGLKQAVPQYAEVVKCSDVHYS